MSCEFTRTVGTPAVRSAVKTGCGCGCNDVQQPKQSGCGCNDYQQNNFPMFPNSGFPFFPMNINVNNSPTTTSNRSETISGNSANGMPVVGGGNAGEVVQEIPVQAAAQRIVKRVFVQNPPQDRVIEERVIGSNIQLQPITKKKFFAIHTVPTWY